MAVTGSVPRDGAITFAVLGTPVPQGSKRGFVNKRTGRAQIVDVNDAGLRDWRGSVANACGRLAIANPALPFDEPVLVHMRFWMPRPKSAPKWKWWASTRPDIDKISRAVNDSMTGPILRDDARIVVLIVEDLLARAGRPPGVEVAVEPLGQLERDGLALRVHTLAEQRPSPP